jgi:hypothetical protein
MLFTEAGSNRLQAYLPSPSLIGARHQQVTKSLTQTPFRLWAPQLLEDLEPFVIKVASDHLMDVFVEPGDQKMAKSRPGGEVLHHPPATAPPTNPQNPSPGRKCITTYTYALVQSTFGVCAQ